MAETPFQTGGPTAKRRPALKGLIMIDVCGGQDRVRAWPRPRGKPKSEGQAERQRRFRLANEACKYWDPKNIIAVDQLRKGTPILIRDLQIMMMYGRYIRFLDANGKWVTSVAARQDVSDSLDQICPLPGAMLIRTDEGWRYVPPPSNIGQVLTADGLTGQASWHDVTPPLTHVDWGDIGGSIAAQVDLAAALAARAGLAISNNFTNAVQTIQGHQIWHAGNLNPTADYAQLAASNNFTVGPQQITGFTIWHAGNLDPNSIRTGSNWYGGYVPLAASFPTLYHNTLAGNVNLSITDDADVGLLVNSGTMQVGGNLRFALKAPPSFAADWTQTIHVRPTPVPISEWLIGIAVRHAASTNSFIAGFQSGGSNFFANLRYQSDTSFFSNHTSVNGNMMDDFWVRVRWVVASSTFFFDYSTNGKQWFNWTGFTMATFFGANTPDQFGIGLYVACASAGNQCGGSIDYWRLT